jgi:hypothetical protein
MQSKSEKAVNCAIESINKGFSRYQGNNLNRLTYLMGATSGIELLNSKEHKNMNAKGLEEYVNNEISKYNIRKKEIDVFMDGFKSTYMWIA